MPDTEMNKIEAIILSMTLDERLGLEELSPPRRRRIANGSGVSIDDVNRMVKNFKRIKQIMKKMPGFKKKMATEEDLKKQMSLLPSMDNLKKEFSTRAGASGIFMAKSESVLSIVSVGNCACYLYRKGRLEKVFIEDSFQFLTNNSYQNHLKTTPLSGFGLFPELDYQVREIRLFSGDKIVALSDGVYSRLSEDELKDVVTNPEIDGKAKIERMFSISNQKGNLDNQSCMILEF